MDINFNPSVKTNTNFQAVSQKYLKTAKNAMKDMEIYPQDGIIQYEMML